MDAPFRRRCHCRESRTSPSRACPAAASPRAVSIFIGQCNALILGEFIGLVPHARSGPGHSALTGSPVSVRWHTHAAEAETPPVMIMACARQRTDGANRRLQTAHLATMPCTSLA